MFNLSNGLFADAISKNDRTVLVLKMKCNRVALTAQDDLQR